MATAQNISVGGTRAEDAIANGHNGTAPVRATSLWTLTSCMERWACLAVNTQTVNFVVGGPRSLKDLKLAFTDAELIAYGATLPEIDALPAPPANITPALESLRWLKKCAELETLRARDHARAALASAGVGKIELPPVTSLADLLDQEDNPVRMRIDGLMPSGGTKGLVVAEAGAGKTTLNCNLVRSLADGDSFLDNFDVHQRAERIVVIDMELNKDMMRRWMRKQGVRNLGAVVDVITLRGNTHLFDMRNDRLRDMWAKRLRDIGCDYLTFDCMKPVIDTMGLNEHNEVGKFLQPFGEMLTAAGVSDVLVYHHMGHTSERARGDSSMLGWTDFNWKLTVQKNEVTGEKSRFFSTDKVRDAEALVKEGLLTYDHGSGRLTYAGGDRAATKQDATVDKRVNQLLEALADTRAEAERAGKGNDEWEMTATALRGAVGGNTDITMKALKRLEAEHSTGATPRVSVRYGKGRARFYTLTDHGLDPMSAGGTDAETGTKHRSDAKRRNRL